TPASECPQSLAQPFEPPSERIATAAERHTECSLTARAVRGTVNHGDALVVKEAAPHLIGLQTEAANIHHREEPALWCDDSDPWHVLERATDSLATRGVLAAHRLDALLRPGERNRCRVLDERGWPAARLLQHQRHRGDDRRGRGAIADPPPGHRVGL